MLHIYSEFIICSTFKDYTLNLIKLINGTLIEFECSRSHAVLVHLALG